VLGLVRVRSAGCPARESVAACRGRSCRCGPAADRTPALQYGRTSLHFASESGHAAVVQTLLQHGADVAARGEVGAAGVPLALAWRSARECVHAIFVRVIVCMEMCARNRARLCCCAEAAALLYV
jgi:ankyrin repeat protein